MEPSSIPRALRLPARVSARNAQTGVVTATVSTGAGVYSISNIRPGTYVVQAEQTGFKKLIRENVVVEVAGVIGLTWRYRSATLRKA
ncbi:MAG: carboxypeptidase-like regulatory domain-containing protein [Bryobacteraceae bacterium]